MHAIGGNESAIERRKRDRRQNINTEVICGGSGKTGAGSAYMTTASLF